MKKYFLIVLAVLLPFSLMAADPVWEKNKTPDSYEITVYSSASCGCCKGWIDHLKDHNFKVNDVKVDDIYKYKSQYNVPQQASSCHTAKVNGLTIEGHVPAQDIKRLLKKEKTDIRLLTVPAMPSGTPGMDTAGAPKHDFNVYSISQDNEVGIFQSYKDY